MKTCSNCGGHIVPLIDFFTDKEGEKHRFWVCYDHNCEFFAIKFVLLLGEYYGGESAYGKIK